MSFNESAFATNITSYRVDSSDERILLIADFLEAIHETVDTIVNFEVLTQRIAKLQIRLFAIYENPIDILTAANEEKNVKTVDFTPRYEVFSVIEDFNEFYDQQKESILQKSEDFLAVGSGWVLQKISHVIVNFNKYDPINFDIENFGLPEVIKRKKFIINIDNDDLFSFLYAVLVTKYEPKKGEEQGIKAATFGI